ncbi:hypothetical protein HDE_10699 [Halotydeus destructor]|nr:hypothetical protein HDE_10699 [Halotydeus destructor]
MLRNILVGVICHVLWSCPDDKNSNVRQSFGDWRSSNQSLYRTTFEKLDKGVVVIERTWLVSHSKIVEAKVPADRLPSLWTKLPSSATVYLYTIYKQRGQDVMPVLESGLDSLAKTGSSNTGNPKAVGQLALQLKSKPNLGLVRFNHTVVASRLFYQAKNGKRVYEPTYVFKNYHDSYGYEGGKLYHEELKFEKAVTPAELERIVSTDKALQWLDWQSKKNLTSQSAGSVQLLSHSPSVNPNGEGAQGYISAGDIALYKAFKDSSPTIIFESWSRSDKSNVKSSFDSFDNNSVTYHKLYEDESTYDEPVDDAGSYTMPAEWKSVDFESGNNKLYVKKHVLQRGRIDFQIEQSEMAKALELLQAPATAEGQDEPTAEVVVFIPNVEDLKMIEFNQSVTIAKLFYLNEKNQSTFAPKFELFNLQDSFWVKGGKIYRKWRHDRQVLGQAELTNLLNTERSLIGVNSSDIQHLENLTAYFEHSNSFPNVENYDNGMFAVLTPSDVREYSVLRDTTPGAASPAVKQVKATPVGKQVDAAPAVKQVGASPAEKKIASIVSTTTTTSAPIETQKQVLHSWKTSDKSVTSTKFSNFTGTTVVFNKRWDDSRTSSDPITMEELVELGMPNVDRPEGDVRCFLEKTVRQRGRVRFQLYLNELTDLVDRLKKDNRIKPGLTLEERETAEQEVATELQVIIGKPEMIEFNQSVTFSRLFFVDNKNLASYSNSYKLWNSQDSKWIEDGKVYHKRIASEKNLTESQLMQELTSNPTLKWAKDEVETTNNGTDEVEPINYKEMFVSQEQEPETYIYEEGMFATLSVADVDEFEKTRARVWKSSR